CPSPAGCARSTLGFPSPSPGRSVGSLPIDCSDGLGARPMPMEGALKEWSFLGRQGLGPGTHTPHLQRCRLQATPLNAAIDLNYFSFVRAETKMSHSRVPPTHGAGSARAAKLDRALRYGVSSSVQRRAGPCRRDGPPGSHYPPLGGAFPRYS